MPVRGEMEKTETAAPETAPEATPTLSQCPSDELVNETKILTVPNKDQGEGSIALS